MEFFEFFFAGPGWGWRALVLVILVSIICNVFTNIFGSIQKMHSKAIMREVAEAMRELNSMENSAATKDDVR